MDHGEQIVLVGQRNGFCGVLVAQQGMAVVHDDLAVVVTGHGIDFLTQQDDLAHIGGVLVGQRLVVLIFQADGHILVVTGHLCDAVCHILVVIFVVVLEGVVVAVVGHPEHAFHSIRSSGPIHMTLGKIHDVPSGLRITGSKGAVLPVGFGVVVGGGTAYTETVFAHQFLEGNRIRQGLT